MKQRITELYDLKSDPGETKNIAGENPDLIKQFNELFIPPLFSEDDKKVN